MTHESALIAALRRRESAREKLSAAMADFNRARAEVEKRERILLAGWSQ